MIPLRSMCRPPRGFIPSFYLHDTELHHHRRPSPAFKSGVLVASCRTVARARSPYHSVCSRVSDPPGRSPCWSDSPPSFRANPRRTLTRASNWESEKSPYETLELERDADDDKIKTAYRRLAKHYHPDAYTATIYDGRGTLEEGETAEARFIKIQAAYELLLDEEKRRQYDKDHLVNPMRASQAWMEWLVKKRKAFDQRGEMAITTWAEQQQREMFLRARNRARTKIDPEEERKILAKEKKASAEIFSNTIKRHTLVLKKRDLMRRKAEEEKQKVISQLLAAEGLELDTDNDDELQ